MSTGLSLVLKLRTRHCPSASPVLCYSPRDCLQAHSTQLTVFRNKYLALARKCNNSLERNRNLSLKSLSMHKGPAAPEDGLCHGHFTQKARRDSNGQPIKNVLQKFIRNKDIQHNLCTKSSRAKGWELQTSINFSMKTKPATKQRNHYAFLFNSCLRYYKIWWFGFVCFFCPVLMYPRYVKIHIKSTNRR